MASGGRQPLMARQQGLNRRCPLLFIFSYSFNLDLCDILTLLRNPRKEVWT